MSFLIDSYHNIVSLAAFRIWISDQDLSESWCIKGTGESVTRADSPAMIQTDLGSLIRIRITPKERSLCFGVTEGSLRIFPVA